MIAVTYSVARDNFKKYCDAAVHDSETILVACHPDENIVLMSETDYNNLIENLHVRSNTADYTMLLESIDQLKAGAGKERELVSDE